MTAYPQVSIVLKIGEGVLDALTVPFEAADTVAAAIDSPVALMRFPDGTYRLLIDKTKNPYPVKYKDIRRYHPGAPKA